MRTVSKFLLLIASIAFLASCGGKQAETTQDDAAADTPVQQEAAGLKAGTYSIAVDKSTLKWVGTHVGKSYEHSGLIALSGGSVTVGDGNISGGSLEVDMTTISVTDIPAEDEKNGKLAGHLAADDFFNVAEFPSASFAIKSVAAGGEGSATHTVTGDLTIKGKTGEVSFPASVASQDNAIMVKGTMTFDRTKFDVMYNSGSLADILKENIISDEVKLEFDVTANM